MSTCTTGTCPHGKDSFIWLGDGPWNGNGGDPDNGRYPWVHAAPVGPGRLEVCDQMPFATPAEAGEVCADCGHVTGRHIRTGPFFRERNPHPCDACDCPGMRYAQPAQAPQQAGDGEQRLMRGESVPGALGACSRPGCAHGALWHRDTESLSRRDHRKTPCSQCRCPGWTDDPEAVMPAAPLVQGDLFSEMTGEAA